MRTIAGLPVIRAASTPPGYAHGWESPPEASPRYRFMVSEGDKTKPPRAARVLERPKGSWFVCGSIYNGKRWVAAFVGKSVLVGKALRELMGDSLVLPERLTAKTAGKPDPDATRKRVRKHNKTARTPGPCVVVKPAKRSHHKKVS